MTTLYTSDTHFDHVNIIKYTQRPFADKNHMNGVLRENLMAAEQSGARIIHAGDLSFDFARHVRQWGPLWTDPKNHLIVLGNHDRTNKPEKLVAYALHFWSIIGKEAFWQQNIAMVFDTLDEREVSVLVSHKPQLDLHGADINVHGHIHNNILLHDDRHHPEDNWTFDSPIHFNASVELHDFKPVTLQQLSDAHRSGYATARAELATRSLPV